MRIALGSDGNGFVLKSHLVERLTRLGHETTDFGCAAATDPTDYPDVALDVASAVADRRFERAILVCGTGIGMSIVANKVAGVRAACCHDPYSAQRARRSNDAQVLTLGAQIVGELLADVLVDEWLAAEFDGGRSTRKVDKINRLDAGRGVPMSSGPEQHIDES